MANQKSNLNFSPAFLNSAVRPTDDFFDYVNGKFLGEHPIPPAEAWWGTFMMLRRQAHEDLKAIVESLAKKKAPQGSDLQLVRDLWLSGMDEQKREELGLEPIKEILLKIERIETPADVVAFAGYAHPLGYDVLWGPYVGQDDKNSDMMIFHLTQGGISLPDRDYYIKNDKESKRIRTAYAAYAEKLMTLAGFSEKEAKKHVKTVLRIETELAKVSMNSQELRNVEKLYNKWSMKQLISSAPKIDWASYLKAIGAKEIKELVVYQPKFVKAMNSLLRKISIQDWQTYLWWRVLDEAAPFLTQALVNQNFEFYGKTLSGTKEIKPLWRRVLSMIDRSIGEALGRLYVERHFNANAKKKINVLVDNLVAAYKERIEGLDWMGEETKKRALKKLSVMKRKLGYPDKWKKYAGLKITPDDYFGNVSRAHLFEFKDRIKKIGGKPDRKEWHMTPPTVNAYYSYNLNEMVFPAGIMQPPFFNPKADDAYNYGGIGSVIGHEITHGFDDEGSKFDAQGNLKKWWTPKDRKAFEKKAEILVNQYNGYEVADGMHVNGKLTLGENIADLGGIVIALKAYERSQKGRKPKIIDGFTPAQRFFFGYAVTEASSGRPEEIKRRVIVDPHSPSKFRVNGPLANIDEFYEAFGVKEGDKLYKAPGERAKIW